LATASFSYMFAMSTAWLVGLGGSTALDTLASASYTGSENPHHLGMLLQRGFIVLTVFYIPMAILWACSTPLPRILGQEEYYICVDSAKFLTALIPGGLGYIYFEAMKKYLQAQGMGLGRLVSCFIPGYGDLRLTCSSRQCPRRYGMVGVRDRRPCRWPTGHGSTCRTERDHDYGPNHQYDPFRNRCCYICASR
jgi:hypothetical protein